MGIGVVLERLELNCTLADLGASRKPWAWAGLARPPLVHAWSQDAPIAHLFPVSRCLTAPRSTSLLVEASLRLFGSGRLSVPVPARLHFLGDLFSFPSPGPPACLAPSSPHRLLSSPPHPPAMWLLTLKFLIETAVVRTLVYQGPVRGD